MNKKLQERLDKVLKFLTHRTTCILYIRQGTEIIKGESIKCDCGLGKAYAVYKQWEDEDE